MFIKKKNIIITNNNNNNNINIVIVRITRRLMRLYTKNPSSNESPLRTIYRVCVLLALLYHLTRHAVDRLQECRRWWFHYRSRFNLYFGSLFEVQIVRVQKPRSPRGPPCSSETQSLPCAASGYRRHVRRTPASRLYRVYCYIIF